MAPGRAGRGAGRSLIFLAGSAGLRAYIRFILDHNHAYGTLAAPIAALLFFFVLALGVLLGAEFNAAIEQMTPSKARRRGCWTRAAGSVLARSTAPATDRERRARPTVAAARRRATPRSRSTASGTACRGRSGQSDSTFS